MELGANVDGSLADPFVTKGLPTVGPDDGWMEHIKVRGCGWTRMSENTWWSEALKRVWCDGPF